MVNSMTNMRKKPRNLFPLFIDLNFPIQTNLRGMLRLRIINYQIDQNKSNI